jgi:hypothetical protein
VKSMLRTIYVAFLTLSMCPSGASGQSPFKIDLDVVRKSVVFLHKIDAQGNLQEAGTGFLLSVPVKSNPNLGYYLLVTARHIVDPEWMHCPAIPGSLVAILNKKAFDSKKDETGVIKIPLAPLWMVPDDDSADVAVTILNPTMIDWPNIENEPISIKDLPAPDELKEINTGAQIVSAGLLLGASGTQRNYPIFKFGYVSSIPGEKIPTQCCPTCSMRTETEWMIAASLVPGNSGSPIIYIPAGPPGLSLRRERAFLVGVQSSSFLGSDVAGMTPITFLLDAVRKLNLGDSDLNPRGLADGASPAVPSGASPGVPAVPGPLPTPNPKTAPQ